MNVMTVKDFLSAKESAACVITASLAPVGGQDRFQPAGFPEIGHVLYRAPRSNGRTEDVCIVDSAASMANHLESVCMAGSFESELHADLHGLPYVLCVTDRDKITPSKDDQLDIIVCTSLTEGHRLASDYFLDARFNPQWLDAPSRSSESKKQANGAGWRGQLFRKKLREEFKIVEVTKDKKYFVYPDNWWPIFSAIFRYDPNSLVHGVLFAKEQIKISRLLSASLEAFGAQRVGSSGVKFDRLGKTLSGQPIFSVDEEVACEIRATFVIDLALLRSYGRDGKGLSDAQKRLLLELAFWKIGRLTAQPFRFRSGCLLECHDIKVVVGESKADKLPEIDIRGAITACKFSNGVTSVYYPADELFTAGKETPQAGRENEEQPTEQPTEPDDGDE